MLVTTLGWVVLMAAMTLYAINVHFLDPDQQHSGGLVINQNSGTISRESDWVLGGIIGTATLGLCCPTIPYAIIMVVLAVAHFATRDS